ncbi:MAG: hypothetical protein AAF497_29830, partial [Planctomycetota bacterium]
RGWYMERSKQNPRYLPPRHLQRRANDSNNVDLPSQPPTRKYDWRADSNDARENEVQPIPEFRRDSWEQQSRDEDGRTASLITYTRWKAQPTRTRDHDSDSDWYSARR